MSPKEGNKWRHLLFRIAGYVVWASIAFMGIYIYLNKKISKNVIFEGLLMSYFVFGIYSSFYLHDFSILFLHLMLSIGFAYVFIQSIVAPK